MGLMLSLLSSLIPSSASDQGCDSTKKLITYWCTGAVETSKYLAQRANGISPIPAPRPTLGPRDLSGRGGAEAQSYWLISRVCKIPACASIR